MMVATDARLREDGWRVEAARSTCRARRRRGATAARGPNEPRDVARECRLAVTRAGRSARGSTMSRVPPVSIAAMGTPRAAASSSTRLSDSGPCDGTPAPTRAASSRAPGRAAASPAREDRPSLMPAPARSSSEAQAGHLRRRRAAAGSRSRTARRPGAPRPCSARACRRRAGRARRSGPAQVGRRGECPRRPPGWECADVVPASSGARASRSACDHRADGDDGIGCAQSSRFRRRLARMYGMQWPAPACRPSPRVAPQTAAACWPACTPRRGGPRRSRRSDPTSSRPASSREPSPRPAPAVASAARTAGTVVRTCCAWTMSTATGGCRSDSRSVELRATAVRS